MALKSALVFTQAPETSLLSVLSFYFSAWEFASSCVFNTVCTHGIQNLPIWARFKNSWLQSFHMFPTKRRSVTRCQRGKPRMNHPHLGIYWIYPYIYIYNIYIYILYIYFIYIYILYIIYIYIILYIYIIYIIYIYIYPVYSVYSLFGMIYNDS